MHKVGERSRKYRNIVCMCVCVRACGLEQLGFGASEFLWAEPVRFYLSLQEHSNLRHSMPSSYTGFSLRYMMSPREVLMKPQICDVTPGIYRLFFVRFDVFQRSADEAAGL